MKAEDLIIGDIILIDTGKNKYILEILNINSKYIEYRYSDFKKNKNCITYLEFNNMFNIIERIKLGDGKIKSKSNKYNLKKK